MQIKKPGVRPGFLFWLAGIVACVAMTAGAAERRPDAKLAAFFEREFQYQLRESPESATYTGVNDYNDRLVDLSFEAIARRKAHVRSALDEVQRFDPKSLNTQDAISRALMIVDLKTTIGYDTLYGSLPFHDTYGWKAIWPFGGPAQALVALSKAMPFVTVRDYENYLKRLGAFPRRLAQTTALLREAMRSGWMPSRAALSRVPSQFDAFLVDDVTASPLYRPFAQFPQDIGADDRARLQAAARAVLADQVDPALATFKTFVVDDYLPACKDEIAASALPHGEAYYTLLVRESTTTTLTPREVHDLGLSEVTRIGARMDEQIRKLGFSGTRAAFYDTIRADPRFYYTDPDAMLRDYRDLAKRVDAELPKLFATLPRLPYGVRAMEAYEGDAAEHYTPGALDGSRAGFFEANVLSLKTRPRYDMENTFLHEAVPGHHLQGARAAELEGLPKFRRAGGYNAYVEGWGLYAESLGEDLGVYRDPYALLGAYAWEMVRACRLGIEPGIHAFGWTRERAIAYMMENAGLQRGFAEAEIDRYIAGPGQATGYKVGQLRMVALRDQARAALGERFDIRRFHNVLLDDGPVPLTVLDDIVGRWIVDEKRRAAH